MSSPRAPRRRRPRRQRSVTSSLAAILLTFEFLLVALVALALFGLKALPPAVALGGGGALLALIVVAAAVASLPSPAAVRTGVALGWLVQAVLLATFALNVGVGLAGLFFAAIWTYGMITGRRLDRRTV